MTYFFFIKLNIYILLIVSSKLGNKKNKVDLEILHNCVRKQDKQIYQLTDL